MARYEDSTSLVVTLTRNLTYRSPKTQQQNKGDPCHCYRERQTSGPETAVSRREKQTGAPGICDNNAHWTRHAKRNAALCGRARTENKTSNRAAVGEGTIEEGEGGGA